jgi:hypothetical protein
MQNTQSQSELARLFSSPESIVQKEEPRLCIQLEALDKCGKTHWALHTAPDPCMLVTNDPGSTRVLKKALAAGRRIPYVMELSYPDPDPAVTKSNQIDAADHAVWKKEWARYKAGMQALLHDRTIRTLITDTEDAMWNLCMLSHFGKIRAIPQHLRTECNSDYNGVFWSLYKQRPDLNMIRIHKLKKEYKPNSKGENDWTGKYEAAGYNQSAFQVDVVLRAGWDGVRKCFYTEMDRVTRFGFDLVGKRWSGEESGFGWLALEIFPETALTPELWGIR